MGEELKKTDPEMQGNAEKLDPELLELSDELMEKIAGGGEDWEILSSLCPNCKESQLGLARENGKPVFFFCPNCDSRFYC